MEKMTKRERVENLIAAHPGNTNAVKTGVYSERARAPRTDELARELESEYGAVTNLVRHAIRDVAGLEAMIEALDADLQTRGYVDRKGAPRESAVLRTRVTSRLSKARLELLELVKQERIAEQTRQVAAHREQHGSPQEQTAMRMESERAQERAAARKSTSRRTGAAGQEGDRKRP
jgi:hypothetical protein